VPELPPFTLPLFDELVLIEPPRITEFGVGKLETPLSRTVQKVVFQYLISVGVDHECDRWTDGQTDRLCL